MQKVIIKNILQVKDFDLSTTLLEYAKGGKVLFITDKPELSENLNTINMNKLVSVCASNIGQSDVTKLKMENPGVTTVVFHTGRIIDRFFNEILNVKKIKAKDYFQGWDVDVVIFTKNESMNSMMTNNDKYYGKPYHQVEREIYGPKKGKAKKK